MKAPDNIDELLSGFIDGQLTTRQQTEVQRLLVNDPNVAQRLERLRRYKMLIGSLPRAEAPDRLLDDIRASLARRTLLGERPAAFDERAGFRELLVRKVFAAAAMIALVAVLGAVVYTIVAPETAPEQPLIAQGDVEPAPPMLAMRFDGRLELTTATLIEVDASINRAIEDNGLVECTGVDRRSDRTTYVLTCGRKGLNSLLANLESHWPRFDSATLFVETEVFAQPVVVEAVTAGQIARIAGCETLESSILVANDFAILNDVAEQLRSRAIFATDDKSPHLITIPKPALTKYEPPTEKPDHAVEDAARVNLVITIVAGK
jgi:hypothetical protein